MSDVISKVKGDKGGPGCLFTEKVAFSDVVIWKGDGLVPNQKDGSRTYGYEGEEVEERGRVHDSWGVGARAMGAVYLTG